MLTDSENNTEYFIITPNLYKENGDLTDDKDLL